MKTIIKSGLNRLIDSMVAVMSVTSPGRYVCGEIVSSVMNRTQAVTHGGSRVVLSVPNALNKYRADTFSTKEPETLQWIDRIAPDRVLWDIGANVGLYTCYAAKARGCRVFAFEPSVFNLEMLARNIFLNGVTKRVVVIPLPLSDVMAFRSLNMTTMEWGGARSTFGQSYGDDGRPLRKIFEVQTIGLSMTDATELHRVPQPDYIKIDVDGIEHLILKGGLPVLRRATSVLLEINEAFTTQATEARECLEDVGFTRERVAAGGTRSNQIWTRDSFGG